MNINELFKYKKTIDFGKYNNGDETFFSRCEHGIAKFVFRIHQTNEIVENDMPILIASFPEKGTYDVTCVSEMEENCTHLHKGISTYKIDVDNRDIVVVKILTNLISVLITIGLVWIFMLGLNTLF